MGISLNGLTPAGTYPGLIKTGDNTAISGTPKVLSDGNGNNLPMEVSTTGVNLTGSPTVNAVAIANTTQVAAKQDTLVSGTNIKTINSTSILGSGNINVVTSPSGVSGAIQFSNGSAFASDASNLFWDDTNNRLGVGTNTPSATGHFKGSGSTSATTSLLVQNSVGASSLQVTDDGSVYNLGKGAVTSNSAFGRLALNTNTSGAKNTAVGAEALLFNTAGTGNTAVGFNPLKDNTSGNNNVAIGHGALYNNITGSNNTAIGYDVLSGNFNGSVILGKDATATASNQFVVGSTGTNAGSVVTESNSSTKVWNVIINGVAQKILLA